MPETPEILSAPPPRARGLPGTDVLSDVLRVVRLSGATLFRGVLSEPWCFSAVGGEALARLVGLPGRCVVVFHVLMEGRCWIELEGERRSLEAGDVVILAHGGAHTVGAGEPVPARPLIEILPPPPWGELADVVHGGAGAVTHLLCGFLHCDALGFQPLLASLPHRIVMSAFAEDASDWLRSTVRYIVREANDLRPGKRLMLERLPEMVFVEVLREVMARADAPAEGWLAAVRDRHVGRALELIHAQPARPWSVPDLALAAGVSRSAFAERFRRLVGQSPMDYVKAWRLNLACALLTDSRRKLSDVAEAVGYESEAAFNKAFRRALGAPPGAWRASRASSNS